MAKKSLNRSLMKKALKHLSSSDRVLSGLIGRHGPCPLAPSVDNPFHALASSIISQQISAHAARAIKGRLFELLGTTQFTGEGFLKRSEETLRAAGLSRAKVASIQRLARAVRAGELDFGSLAGCEDEEVILRLIPFSGVGRWTAEMFLIFGLGRTDVLSVHDAGLRKGMMLAYGLEGIPSPAEMMSIGEPWRPYRSVASWYLWRVVDPLP
jgi:DNA-3-methyladenine glycosylase II